MEADCVSNRLDWLRRHTSARVALGEALRTPDWLALREAHAAARDAIDAPCVWPRGVPVVRSRCRDRHEYLLRPDLGRRLDPSASLPEFDADVALIVCDGLSPLAVSRHAEALLAALHDESAGLRLGAPVAVENGRVAIGDEIGERWRARLACVLIGERPGLSAADSLGVYLTYDPRVGRTDADRNCLSNIREEGLSPANAARRAVALMRSALSLGLTGVSLKEDVSRALPSAGR
jgi:ethanolamine ammonia-lyase small subunit